MTLEGDIRDRLTAVAERIAGLRVELEDECEARDRLVLEATDLGWLRSEIASWARITKSRVTQIVSEQSALSA